MTPMDMLKFNPCNLDHLTETYNIGFYLEYFTKWPQLCKVIEGDNGQIEAYSKTFQASRSKFQHDLTRSKFSARSSHHHIQLLWSRMTLV